MPLRTRLMSLIAILSLLSLSGSNQTAQHDNELIHLEGSKLPSEALIRSMKHHTNPGINQRSRG
jgi:hypothetical protein